MLKSGELADSEVLGFRGDSSYSVQAVTHRLQCTSLLGLPSRILNISHNKGTTMEPLGTSTSKVRGLEKPSLRGGGGGAIGTQP